MDLPNCILLINLRTSSSWFLENPDLDWTPSKELLDWMDKARSDGKPIVYIGFGSITVPHPGRVTGRIINAVLKSMLPTSHIHYNLTMLTLVFITKVM